MRTLVVYYSLSGTTRTLAEALAKSLAADIEEIRCSRYAPGIWSYIRAGYDSLTGTLPGIGPLARAPSGYDLVVIGGPVWAGRVATPVKTYLKEQSGRLPRIAFFLTMGGSAGTRWLPDMEEMAHQEPQATLVMREADVNAGRLDAAATFTTGLRASETVG